jgi:microcystin-dependent protein
MQPTLALHYIIAEQGIYPSRDGGGSAEEPLLGQINLFAGNFAPGGWAFCDGQLLAISQNTALFSLLGTTFGGNGQTDFALPNLDSQLAIGAGQGQGLSPWSLGQTGGTELNTLSIAQMPAHDHAFTPMPEPASLGVLALGSLMVLRRRRN